MEAYLHLCNMAAYIILLHRLTIALWTIYYIKYVNHKIITATIVFIHGSRLVPLNWYLKFIVEY